MKKEGKVDGIDMFLYSLTRKGKSHKDILKNIISFCKNTLHVDIP
jgi:hypothetical protein